MNGTGASACELAAPNFAREDTSLLNKAVCKTLLLYPCWLASAQRYDNFLVFLYPRSSSHPKPLYVHCGLATFILKGKLSVAFPRLRRPDNRLRSWSF